MKALLDRLHRWLARSRLAVFVALKLRNQCAAVIAYRLAPSPHHDLNGEQWLIQQVAGSVRTFVDVGARHGDWAALVTRHARPGVQGLLFEPDPDCLAGLRAKFAALHVCPRALGAEPGELPFQAAGERSRLLAPGPGAAGAPRVTVSTLDRELAQQGWSAVDLVKIDAEGHDFLVMRGASATLAAQRIGVLQFEYGDQWPAKNATLAGAIGFLAACGYETWLLQPDGLEPVRHDVWGEHFNYSNYVAIAPSHRALLERWVRA